MRTTEIIPTTPIRTEKTVRMDQVRALTSGKAGKILPLAYIPLLREDRVSRGSFRLRFEMNETVETLMNAVNVTVYAHFVPFLASERFNGLDQMNRSYKGIPETEGGSAVPFFETINYNRTHEIWATLGVHAKNDEPINAWPIEAYNLIVNHRRKARSKNLPLRTRLQTDLAQAFWKNTGMAHIVPDFDQALIDGDVPLQLLGGQLPIKGIGILDGFGGNATNQTVQQSDGTTRNGWTVTSNSPAGALGIAVNQQALSTALPEIYAELNTQGVTLSLANIELAKDTVAFAKMRQTFSGLSDEHLIDLLMEGVRVPDEQLKQPILLDRQSTIFGYSKRYATDSGNLDKSVSTGETVVDIRFRTPPMNTGGMIYITAEIVPEQMFERQQDMFLYTTQPEVLPSFLRDFLDPEKVAIVKNKFVDVEHATPDATFGYAPLNHEWKRNIPRIGGKFFRQLGDPFVEDRQRFWAVETLNPALTADFYLVNTLHNNVFADTLSDNFEVQTLGMAEIVGNTVFGKPLMESSDDYETILAQVDTGRIVQA